MNAELACVPWNCTPLFADDWLPMVGFHAGFAAGHGEWFVMRFSRRKKDGDLPVAGEP